MEENTVQTVKTKKRSFVGLVTSDKMDKTVVVTVATKKWIVFTRNMLPDLRSIWHMMKQMMLI